MRTDSDIRRDVEEELRWDPEIDPTDISVSVNNGVVALTGFVRRYTERYLAEADAKRVAGVVGVANDLEVRLPDIDRGRIPRSPATPSHGSRASYRMHGKRSEW